MGEATPSRSQAPQPQSGDGRKADVFYNGINITNPGFLDYAKMAWQGAGDITHHILDSNQEAIHTPMAIISAGIAKKLPNGLFLNDRAADALRNSPDPTMRRLYYSIQSLDPSAMPAFISDLTAEPDKPDPRGLPPRLQGLGLPRRDQG
jgi:hypothetical protein